MEFRLLGSLEVVNDDGGMAPLGPPRQHALLAALVLHAGSWLSVEQLVDLLWGERPPATAATIVHGSVAGLRRVLEPARERGNPARLLVTRPTGYALEVHPEQVDALRFERLLAEGRRHLDSDPERASGVLTEALALWRGPALSGVEEDFARAAAMRLEELRLDALEARIEADLALGRHREVVAELEGLVARHPLRERLWAHRMVALYRCGRQAEALAAYQTLRRTLAEELGVEPGRELHRMELAVLQHHPSLEVPRPRPRPGLPAPLSSFVGRGTERQEVAVLLGAGRLVTLTGPGGSGKTRLAVEVAREVTDRFPAGAWLVDLAPLSTSALVVETVAEALGVRVEPGRALLDTLAASLAVREGLLVLDNCERVVDACAVLAQELLTASERTRVLATSREPLGVPGEAVYPVPPLAVPDKEDPWNRVAASEAVRLFAARAAAARPGFAVTEGNAHLIAEVCRRLDGIPLALELAAARVATMPLRRIADRLDDRFRLLDSATRATPSRHRSLAAAVAWTYDLLAEEERLLFERLSVFAGGFTLDAVEAIAAEDDVASDDAAEVLSRLVARSLVQLEPGAGGEARYRLLETSRQYGRERLEEQAMAGHLQQRHAQHYLSVAEEAEPRLYQAGSRPWLERLQADHDNFRAALEWSFSLGGDPEVGARLVGLLWDAWDLRGARGEGLHWVEAGLRVIGMDRPRERAKLLSAGALFHLGRGEFDAVEMMAAEELALARAARDRCWEGDALALLATVAWARGEFSRAQRQYGDAIAASLDAGDLWRASMAETQLARLHRDRGDLAQAEAVAGQALAHADHLGEDVVLGLALDLLASLAHRRGDAATARGLVEEALGHYRAVGYREGEASALHLAGRLALQTGDREAARFAFDQALELCRRVGHRGGMAAGLEGRARVAAAAGDDEAAVLLLGAASALRDIIGAPLPETERAEQDREIDRLDARLGHPVLERIWRRGAQMGLDEVLRRIWDPESRSSVGV
jgi:predicted ATPase/DNA-binding SARP family transcriptional activator